MFNRLKNGFKNYVLFKKLSKLKMDKNSNTEVMFILISKIMNPLEKIPNHLIQEMKESNINQILTESLEKWNKSVFFAESMNKAFREKYFSDLNENELKHLQHSFFKLDFALSNILKNPSYDFNALAVYAANRINIEYQEIGNEIYTFLKREYQRIEKSFEKGITDRIFKLSFDENKKNYLIETTEGKYRIPEELVADMAFGLIETEDKDTFKQYSNIFLKTVTNERFEKLSSDKKVKVLNFITSDRDFIKETSLSFDRDNIKDMMKEIEYYLQKIKEDQNISPSYKKELLNDKGKFLLALAQSFVLENIKRLLDSPKAGDALIEEYKSVKEENYSVLKEVSEELSKSTGDTDIKEFFQTFGKNVKNYLKNTKGMEIKIV